MTAYYNEIDPYAAAWLGNLIDAGHIAPGEVDTRSIVDVRSSDLAGFQQCHFFAGIGGWSLALRLAGWPDGQSAWTGSCPCQPFSKAGRGDGFEDDRHLWPEWSRLISECRPAIVFGEQVPVAVKHGWFDLIAGDLEAQNYAVGTIRARASCVGAPIERQRLWFVAQSLREGMAGQFSSSHPGPAGPMQWRGEEDLRAIADAPFEPGSRWPQPLVRRVDDGLSEHMGALRAFGNAIVPQAAALFIGAAMSALSVTSPVSELEQAEAECERLRKLAHEAPLNPYRLDADGHRWIEQYSSAWASRSNDWIKACEHRDKLRAVVSRSEDSK